MIAQMEKVASSPVVAILGAGAALANPGAFIPIALKDISELDPSAAEYVVDWVFFSLVSLLPLAMALVLLLVAPALDEANARHRPRLARAERAQRRGRDRRAARPLAAPERDRRAHRLSFVRRG